MHSLPIPIARTTKTCWIPLTIQQQLEVLARQWAPLEVGGVLAGYWRGDVAVITDCIGPGKEANHSGSSFYPDYSFHEREIGRLYSASHGTTVYLGDWHTHPWGPAILSSTDKRTLRAIADAPEARCTQPLMLLLAGQADAWSIQAFTLSPKPKVLPRRVLHVELKTF